MPGIGVFRSFGFAEPVTLEVAGVAVVDVGKFRRGELDVSDRTPARPSVL